MSIKLSQEKAQKAQKNSRAICAFVPLCGVFLANLDPISDLEFGIGNGSGFYLFDRVLNGHQTAAGTFARKFDFVVGFGCSTGRKKSLEQCDTGLKHLLAGITNVAADIVKLLRLARRREKGGSNPRSWKGA